MVCNKVTLALALAFVAGASSAPGAPGVYAGDYYAYPKYSYSYGVKDALTGDQKSAHETRDGDLVKGSYSLVQPDGVLRTVNYVAGGHLGFQAEVVNSAPAVHAVKKVVAPVAVAPVAAYGHGYGHGYGHEYAAPIAKAVAAPIAYGHGYGHGGYAPVVAAVKPAAVSYTHGVGPVVGVGHGYGHDLGHAGYGHGLGFGHHAALGYAGAGHGLAYGGGLGHHGGFAY